VFQSFSIKGNPKSEQVFSIKGNPILSLKQIICCHQAKYYTPVIDRPEERGMEWNEEVLDALP